MSETKKPSFYERVVEAQNKLKAPKGQRNNFGKYNYRSCEDILEAAKPVCKEFGLVLNLSDTLELIGNRYYIKATARLDDANEESVCSISSTAYAREPEDKKGMDESQITGTASSYARKYALNGLFCIDDTKDADTDEYGKQTGRGESKKAAPAIPPEEPVICSSCGKPITAHNHGGHLYTVSAIAQNSVKSYGKPMCWNCMIAAKAQAIQE